MRRSFHVASDEEIKTGKTTDLYFLRTKEILQAKGLAGVRATAEITVSSLPNNWPWAILCGVEEVASLLEGYPVNVSALPEGTLFYGADRFGVREPIMVIEGPYSEFCVLETPALGFLCQATGIATMAARLRKIAGERILMSFGVRRMHPALCPMIDRAAYLGGFDGVSSLRGAEQIQKPPMGTMPHALIVVFGDQVKAWKAFDEVMDARTPRIALADTYFDEKTEAIMAAEALGERLYGVRLDTPSTRRGDMTAIVREVRWELNIRGFHNVKIFASGGLSDKNIRELCEVGVDGFGVGTALSDAPSVDFALDLVEVEGRPAAKRGKLGGKKQLWRCPSCLSDLVTPHNYPAPECPECKLEMEAMLKPLIENGKLVSKPPGLEEIRANVLRQLEKVQV